jgi:predicted DNA binding protein
MPTDNTVRRIEFSWAHDCPFNQLTESYPGLTIDWDRPGVGIDAETAFGRFSLRTPEKSPIDTDAVIAELSSAPSVLSIERLSDRIFNCVLRREMLTMAPELLAECFTVTIKEADGVEEWGVVTSSPRVEEFLFETLNETRDGRFELRRTVSMEEVTCVEDESAYQSLTDKQREAIRQAYDTGYFESPREATAEEVAAELDITASSFTSRVRRGQRRLFTELFE